MKQPLLKMASPKNLGARPKAKAAKKGTSGILKVPAAQHISLRGMGRNAPIATPQTPYLLNNLSPFLSHFSPILNHLTRT